MLGHVEEKAHLRETVGSLPDYSNKASITIKAVKWIFWLPSVYKCYVYIILQSIKCAVALYLKKQ